MAKLVFSIVWLIVYVALASTFLFVLDTIAKGAPAPIKKPPPVKVRPNIVGNWKFTWGSYSEGDYAAFTKDGYFFCQWSDTHYQGNYTLIGDVLKVTEWSVSDIGEFSSTSMTWWAHIKKDKLEGFLSDPAKFIPASKTNYDFKLEPLKVKLKNYD